MTNLRKEIVEAIGITMLDTTSAIAYKILESTKEDGYTRQMNELLLAVQVAVLAHMKIV